MALYHEVMNDVLAKERAAGSKSDDSGAKEIRIHPEWFYKIAADKESIGSFEPLIDGTYRLCGISLVIDPKVDKWEIIIDAS